MSSKYIGYGSTISVDAANGTSYTAVAGVMSITRGDAQVNDVDTTVLSESTRYESSIAGLVAPGDVTLNLYLDPADSSQKILALLLGNGATAAWKIVYSDSGSTNETFHGWIKSLGQEIPLKEAMTRKVTIHITGAPGYATS